MRKNIEVEVRTFVDDEQFAAIKNILDKGFGLKEELREVTVYFSGDRDLRLRKDDTMAYIILKEGEIHDDFRKEFEVRIEREGFDDTKELFKSLGYSVEIEWHRTRRVYGKGDIKVLLDDTEGYGRILELEEMAKEGEEKDVYSKLLGEIRKLGIEEITSKEEFGRRFEYYKNNWKNLIR